MHSDVAQAGPSRLLDGTATSDLYALIGDFERVLRRAAHLFLIQTVGGDGDRTGSQPPTLLNRYCWPDTTMRDGERCCRLLGLLYQVAVQQDPGQG